MSNCITDCNLDSGNVGCNVSDSQYENTCKPNNLGNNKNQGPDLVSISAHQIDVNFLSVKGRLDVNGASFDGDNLFGLSYMDPLTVDSNNICVDDTLKAKHIITDDLSSLYECTHGLKTKVIGFNSASSSSCTPEFNLNASKQIQFTSNIKLSNFDLDFDGCGVSGQTKTGERCPETGKSIEEPLGLHVDLITSAATQASATNLLPNGSCGSAVVFKNSNVIIEPTSCSWSCSSVSNVEWNGSNSNYLYLDNIRLQDSTYHSTNNDAKCPALNVDTTVEISPSNSLRSNYITSTTSTSSASSKLYDPVYIGGLTTYNNEGLQGNNNYPGHCGGDPSCCGTLLEKYQALIKDVSQRSGSLSTSDCQDTWQGTSLVVTGNTIINGNLDILGCQRIISTSISETVYKGEKVQIEGDTGICGVLEIGALEKTLILESVSGSDIECPSENFNRLKKNISDTGPQDPWFPGSASWTENITDSIDNCSGLSASNNLWKECSEYSPWNLSNVGTSGTLMEKGNLFVYGNAGVAGRLNTEELYTRHLVSYSASMANLDVNCSLVACDISASIIRCCDGASAITIGNHENIIVDCSSSRVDICGDLHVSHLKCCSGSDEIVIGENNNIVVNCSTTNVEICDLSVSHVKCCSGTEQINIADSILVNCSTTNVEICIS
jgi:hypothetical protein